MLPPPLHGGAIPDERGSLPQRSAETQLTIAGLLTSCRRATQDCVRLPDATDRRHAPRRLPDSRPARSGRHGRSLSGHGLRSSVATSRSRCCPRRWRATPNRLARFEREGRMVAALNHPNIVTLYSIEEAGGVRFLTMELVEGQSLDRMLRPGGLPLSRSLRRGACAGGRTRRGAREGHRPPRSQARQRHGDAVRPGQGAGLRTREAVRERRGSANEDGRVAARPQPASCSAPFLTWRPSSSAAKPRTRGPTCSRFGDRPLRADDRATTVSRRQRARAVLGDPARSPAATGRDSARPAAGPGADRPAMPREGPTIASRPRQSLGNALRLVRQDAADLAPHVRRKRDRSGDVPRSSPRLEPAHRRSRCCRSRTEP